jgi:hypothetical protein
MESRRRWQAFAFAAATMTMSVNALADEANQCLMHSDMPVERLLRRLSLDLRATVPDMAEYAAVEGRAEIPGEIIDAYLDSDAFRVQMRRYHESLLWTNPLVSLNDQSFTMRTAKLDDGSLVYYVVGSQKFYRGGDGTHVCQDVPQSQLGYDPSGLPNTKPMGDDGQGPWFAEGWVKVHPYWEADPQKTVKVCAFDAQETETYEITKGGQKGTYPCDHTLSGSHSQACGCGPNLNYCIVPGEVAPVVVDAMREQVLRLVDDVTKAGAHYSGILTSRRNHLNGPLVHYFKYLAQQIKLPRVQNFHQPSDGPLPALKFTDFNTWAEVKREAPHAGVVSLPAYLLRYQTNRGRANRFRIAFEGKYFQPPSTQDSGCDQNADDLTQRCVCRGCHQTLEPLAAYFGRFTEVGSASLASFPFDFASLDACAAEARTRGLGPPSAQWCERFYAPRPDPADPGLVRYTLKAARYANDTDAVHAAIQENFEDGLMDWVEKDIADGTFHEVAARYMFTFLVKREPNVDPTSSEEETAQLDDITAEFRATDDLRLLVKRIVSMPLYRRMP